MMTRRKLLTLALLTEGGLLALAVGAAKFFKNIVFISSYDHVVRDVVMGLLCSLLPLGLFISVCIRPPRFLSSFRKVILTDVRQLFAGAKAVYIARIS
ncbi:MAG: hypothetical protein HQK99_17730, partial [Nitrospirae bacterium]|nr:hypothetical protein [Nitrospirota bacterium]